MESATSDTTKTKQTKMPSSVEERKKKNSIFGSMKNGLFVFQTGQPKCLLCWNQSIQRLNSICFYLTFNPLWLRVNKQSAVQVNLFDVDFKKIATNPFFVWKKKITKMINLSKFQWLIKILTKTKRCLDLIECSVFSLLVRKQAILLIGMSNFRIDENP